MAGHALRALTRDGRWVVLHGASLLAAGTRRVAIIIEPAHPARIAPLLMAAYGLSERKQKGTRLVLQGEATTEIAARLGVTAQSAQTVQRHLKSASEKAGCAAGASWWARCSSPTTSRACATTGGR